VPNVAWLEFRGNACAVLHPLSRRAFGLPGTASAFGVERGRPARSLALRRVLHKPQRSSAHDMVRVSRASRRTVQERACPNQAQDQAATPPCPFCLTCISHRSSESSFGHACRICSMPGRCKGWISHGRQVFIRLPCEGSAGTDRSGCSAKWRHPSSTTVKPQISSGCSWRSAKLRAAMNSTLVWRGAVWPMTSPLPVFLGGVQRRLPWR